MQREAGDDGHVRAVGSRENHSARPLEAAHEREDVVPRAPHPMLRGLGGADGGVPALRPPGGQLLRHRRWQKRQQSRARGIVHRRVADIVADRAGARGVQDQRRIESGAGRDQAVVKTADRVGARIEIAEPAPEPAAVLEGIELRGLREPEPFGRELAEDIDVLDRVDTGERGLGAPGGVLVHEDRQAARVRARAGAARRVGAHRDVELDPIHTRIRERVDFGFGARRVEPTAEAGEPRVRLAFLQHRPGEKDPRPRPGSRVDERAIRRNIVKLTAEIEHGRDARGEEDFRVPLVGRAHVDVHVHEPRGEELVASVDHCRAGREGRRPRETDAGHLALIDDDRCGLARDAAAPIDQSGSDDRDHGGFLHT